MCFTNSCWFGWPGDGAEATVSDFSNPFLPYHILDSAYLGGRGPSFCRYENQEGVKKTLPEPGVKRCFGDHEGRGHNQEPYECAGLRRRLVGLRVKVVIVRSRKLAGG